MNGRRDGRPTRVLLVEDEPLIALDLEQWLTDLGYEVVGPFRRAHDALHALDRTEVDFAVLDYVLSDGTCGGVADRLGSRQVPYIFVTGSREPKLREDSVEAPLLLQKPISRQDMDDALRSLCSSHPRATTPPDHSAGRQGA